MPALKISRRDSELERGEKSAYNLCELLERTAAAGTWMTIPYRGMDFVVSARIEAGGQPIGGPPLVEMANKGEVREAARWARAVARHLSRTQGSATFWSFPAGAKKLNAAFVVQVEAVPEGQGRRGHTEVITVLRAMAGAVPARRNSGRARRKRRDRRS